MALCTSGWAGVTLLDLQAALAGLDIIGTEQRGEGKKSVRLSTVIVLPLNYAEKEIPAFLLGEKHQSDPENVIVWRGGFEEFETYYQAKLDEFNSANSMTDDASSSSSTLLASRTRHSGR